MSAIVWALRWAVGWVGNQIRKVVEGMHWRMHAEPALSIGSHRVTIPHRNHLSLVHKSKIPYRFFLI